MQIFLILFFVLPFFSVGVLYLILSVKNQSSDKSKQVLFPIAFVLSGAVVMIFWVQASISITKNYSFNGVIEKAYYEKPKQIPHITIKSKEYDLGGMNYPDYDTIVAGDTAIKEKGTSEFRLIKHKK